MEELTFKDLDLKEETLKVLDELKFSNPTKIFV